MEVVNERASEEFAILELVDKKLEEVGFERYSTVDLMRLQELVQMFAKEYFADVTVGGSPYDVSRYVFDKYVLNSIRANIGDYSDGFLSDFSLRKIFNLGIVKNQAYDYYKEPAELNKIEKWIRLGEDVN